MVRSGLLWPKLSGDHKKDLTKCDIHLVHISRGVFVELSECQIPMEVADSCEQVTSLVIGELSSPESEAIDQVMTLGLGKAIPSTDNKLIQ